MGNRVWYYLMGEGDGVMVCSHTLVFRPEFIADSS